MFRGLKGLFGKPIRKIKKQAIVGFLVPALMALDSYMGWGLGEELVNQIGGGIAAVVLIWLPIIRGYLAASAPEDVANIPR